MALILAVDDDANVRVVVRQFLESAGHTVITASNGREGLALVRKREPELVLMDVSMPGEMDGVQALAEIKNDPKTCRIPVVMLTAIEGPEAVERAMYEYAEAYLNKPCDKARLLETVASTLSMRRSG